MNRLIDWPHLLESFKSVAMDNLQLISYIVVLSIK